MPTSVEVRSSLVNLRRPRSTYSAVWFDSGRGSWIFAGHSALARNGLIAVHRCCHHHDRKGSHGDDHALSPVHGLVPSRTGLIAGLLAQRLQALDACVLGVALHGRAARLMEAERGTEAVSPAEFPQYMGLAIRSFVQRTGVDLGA